MLVIAVTSWPTAELALASTSPRYQVSRGAARLAGATPRRPGRVVGSRQIGSDGMGGVAVQIVAGVVVPAGGAGVFVAGVVLDVAEGGAGVQGESDRRMAQAVR